MYSVVNERNRTPDQGVGVLSLPLLSLCLRVRRYSLENSRLPVRLARVAVGATRDFRSEQAMAVPAAPFVNPMKKKRVQERI